MDDLASLIIQKLREDDGPTRGMVALASWWYGDERLNVVVQPVLRNGVQSYNILKSFWRSVEVGNVRGCGWTNVPDDKMSTFQPTIPVCNFETIEQAADFLLAMGISGECPYKGGVYSLVIGKNNNGLFRVRGSQCSTKEDVLMWLCLMRDMRAPIV
jgi:hypothetical protein